MAGFKPWSSVIGYRKQPLRQVPQPLTSTKQKLKNIYLRYRQNIVKEAGNQCDQKKIAKCL